MVAQDDGRLALILADQVDVLLDRAVAAKAGTEQVAGVARARQRPGLDRGNKLARGLDRQLQMAVNVVVALGADRIPREPGRRDHVGGLRAVVVEAAATAE